MKRRPVILLILAILLLTALWLGRGWWLPFFQSWLPQLAGDIGNQIQSIEAFVGLLVLIGGGLWGLWAWFMREESANQRADELTPLKATNWQTIRARSPQGARIPWIDRGATDANDLRAQPRLALIGLSGEGKTREAAELIRRAVELELVVESQVFEPNRDFLHTGAAITSSVLDKVVEPTQRACLFIDDLHSYGMTTLEQLATLLALFTHPQLDHRYVIATVRSDLVSAEQQTWLTQQGFHLVRLPKINAKQAEQWLTSAGQVHSLTFSRKVRQTFIEQNQPGTPGHLLRGLLTIKSSLTDSNKGQAPIKPARVAEVMNDLTTQERQALYRRQPLAVYLLTALAHFHAAEVRTAQPLILAYAAMHYRRDHRLFSRWQAWRRGQTLRRTLSYLANFDVSVQNGLIITPDALLESAVADDARSRVGDFLVAYRRPFHNRLLRRFHRHAEVQRWALFELANDHQERQEHMAATYFYTAAIQIDPHPWCYNNRGVERKSMQQIEAAIQDYGQAIGLTPRYATAYNNRGVARSEIGLLLDAISDFDQAITLNPKFAHAYYNRGNTRKDEGLFATAIKDYTQAISLFSNSKDKANSYNNRGLIYAKLGQFTAAITDYDCAIALNPQLATAYNNRGNTLAELGLLKDASIDFDKAIILFLDGKHKATAYNNRGLTHAELGQITDAIQDYTQAVTLAPYYAEAYYNRGLAHYVQNQFTDAIQDYNIAITLSPDYAKAFGNRSLALWAVDNLAGAVNDLMKAIQLFTMDSDKAQAFEYLGKLYQKANKEAIPSPE